MSWDLICQQYYDRHVMENMKLLDAGPEGSVLFELYVDESLANLNNVMHGGAAGVIFDMGTTTALGPLARPDFWLYGYSSFPHRHGARADLRFKVS